VTAERDQLAVEVATLQGRSATVLAELDQRAAKNENTAKRLSADLAAYKRTTEADFFAELEQQRRISEHFCLAHLKSQALLGLILAKPQCRSYFFSRGFDKSFEAAWYRPRETFELFGTVWLWEEMKEQGLFEGSKLFNKADLDLLARFGDADDGLARMKAMATAICRDSPAK